MNWYPLGNYCYDSNDVYFMLAANDTIAKKNLLRHVLPSFGEFVMCFLECVRAFLHAFVFLVRAFACTPYAWALDFT